MNESDVTKDIERSTQLTYEGLNLLAGCQLGQELRFTRVVMGNGDIPEGQDIKALKSLVNPVLELPIVSAKATGVGTVKIGCRLKNAGLPDGYWAKEVGIFAQSGENRKEILYAYRNTGDKSEYVPAGGGSEIWDFTYNVITVIDQAENITAVFNGEASYVDIIEFMNHEESENPHPNFLKKGEEVTTADNLVCGLSEDSRELNHISMDNLKRQMLGDISDIPLLNSRVRQLERENAALALKMEAENMMPDCNMLLTENFNFSTDNMMAQNSDINMTKIKVLSAVAGDNSIDVNTVTNVCLGDWLWITDGLRSEYVQIKSTIKNSNIYRVLITNALVNTYNLDNTYMYYTTAYIGNGNAYGSADIIGQKYTPAIVWKGMVGNTEYTADFDTSQNVSDNFDISGMGMFSVDDLLSIDNGGVA